MWFLVELDPPHNLVMLKEEPRTPPQLQVVKICWVFFCCRCLRSARPGSLLHLALSLAGADSAKLLLPCSQSTQSTQST